MVCGKCGKSCKAGGLCPFSFGLALGITYGLFVLFMALVIVINMAPPEMEGLRPHLTWMTVIMHSLWALLKGFIFGLVMALIYDGFICIGKKCRCGKADNNAANVS